MNGSRGASRKSDPIDVHITRQLESRNNNANQPALAMPLFSRLTYAALIAAASAFAAVPASAQSGDSKASDKPANAQPADAAKEAQRQADEFAEASRTVSGPGGNPECVWLGRRVVGLMWRDDMDTAFRHLDLYDRFGCPGQHIQAAFRCVVRQGNIDPKSPQSLNSRVHGCWLNPSAAAQTAAGPAPAVPAGAAAASTGAAPASTAPNTPAAASPAPTGQGQAAAGTANKEAR